MGSLGTAAAGIAAIPAVITPSIVVGAHYILPI
jgi:hypothetical protein